MIKRAVRTILATALFASSAFPQAKNVILFVGDGAGIASLNAASIYGYGQPRALYLQKMPNLALADTSTAKEWVTDGAACASAWATGHKTSRGTVSMSADAERDVRDGEIYKTVMEYAMENGLSTGVVSNEGNVGVTDAVVSAFYAHHNNRGRSADIMQQALNPKFGRGINIMIGTGRKSISAQTARQGRNLAADIKASGYAYVDSMAALAGIDKGNDRVIALFDDDQFDVNEAVNDAVARLSKNPKGFFLVAYSDCHTGKVKTSLQRLIDLDKVIAATTERMKADTLVLFTADHSYDLRIKGAQLVETTKASDHRNILQAVSLEDEHTAEEVPLLAAGPGSERVKGYMLNTDVFRVIMANFGWGGQAASR
jgi:alkaline phosphatase